MMNDKTGFDTTLMFLNILQIYIIQWSKTKLDHQDGVISGSSQIDHDQTTNFNANEHLHNYALQLWVLLVLVFDRCTVIDKTYLDDEVYNTSLNSYAHQTILR